MYVSVKYNLELTMNCFHRIVGWNSTVGVWTRLEGTPCDPNPNKPFAKMDNVSLFNHEGKLNPSITILGISYTVIQYPIIAFM